MPSVPTTPAPCAVLILGRYSPRPTSARLELLAEADRRGVAVVTVDEKDPRTAVAAAVSGFGAGALAVCASARVQASVAAVAVGRDLPFACIPAGPEDLLAADVHGPGIDLGDALRRSLSGPERAIDLAEVNGIAFVNYVAFGVRIRVPPVSEGDRGEGLERWRATVRRAGSPGVRPLGLGDRFLAPALLVSNNCFQVQRGDLFGRPCLDAGVLGITTCDQPPGGPPEDARDIPWRMRVASGLELAAGGPVEANVDGRDRQLHPPLRFRTLPGALRVRGA